MTELRPVTDSGLFRLLSGHGVLEMIYAMYEGKGRAKDLIKEYGGTPQAMHRILRALVDYGIVGKAEVPVKGRTYPFYFLTRRGAEVVRFARSMRPKVRVDDQVARS